MTILGIDPGFARTGYGVLKKINHNNYDVLEFGCITTSAGVDFSDRLLQISQDLDELITRFKPNEFAIENLFFFKNKKTIITVSAARGVLMMIARKNNIPVYEYTPLQVKQSVTGYGKAEKTQVMSMVKSILSIKNAIKLDDASDALAVALCHGSCLAYNSKFLK